MSSNFLDYSMNIIRYLMSFNYFINFFSLQVVFAPHVVAASGIQLQVVYSVASGLVANGVNLAASGLLRLALILEVRTS